MAQPKLICFDVDGTLMETCRFELESAMIQSLLQVPSQVQLSICSGRPLEYTLQKLEPLFQAAQDPEKERSRWFIVTDTGSAAYRYDAETKTYQVIFEIPWPEAEMPQEKLAEILKRELGFFARIVIRTFTMVVVYPRWLYFFPRLLLPISKFFHKKTKQSLAKHHLLGTFHVKDSGLGNLINPVQSGKGQAVQILAKHLNIKSEETLCIGDRPDPGGNDEDFLDGTFGIPYTVGYSGKQARPVLNEQGITLKGPEGVRELLSDIPQKLSL